MLGRQQILQGDETRRQTLRSNGRGLGFDATLKALNIYNLGENNKHFSHIYFWLLVFLMQNDYKELTSHFKDSI